MDDSLPPDAVILLTGADSRLGRALAARFAPHASMLALVGGGVPRAMEADARELELEHEGLATRTFLCDLADDADLAELMHRVRTELPRVDVWVHVSSLGERPGRLGEGPWEPREQLIQAEVRTLARLAHAWVGPMVDRRRGGMLWVGSAGATLPLAEAPLRAAVQRFMDGLAESLRVRLVGSGVTLTEVHAGPTTTEVMNDVARGREPAPLSRWALSPEEVAAEAVDGFLQRRARVVPGFGLRQTLRAVSLLPGPLRRVVFGLAALRVRASRAGDSLDPAAPRPLLH